jgi:hypothetical protein
MLLDASWSAVHHRYMMLDRLSVAGTVSPALASTSVTKNGRQFVRHARRAE